MYVYANNRRGWNSAIPTGHLVHEALNPTLRRIAWRFRALRREPHRSREIELLAPCLPEQAGPVWITAEGANPGVLRPSRFLTAEPRRCRLTDRGIRPGQRRFECWPGTARECGSRWTGFVASRVTRRAVASLPSSTSRAVCGSDPRASAPSKMVCRSARASIQARSSATPETSAASQYTLPLGGRPWPNPVRVLVSAPTVSVLVSAPTVSLLEGAGLQATTPASTS